MTIFAIIKFKMAANRPFLVERSSIVAAVWAQCILVSIYSTTMALNSLS